MKTLPTYKNHGFQRFYLPISYFIIALLLMVGVIPQCGSADENAESVSSPTSEKPSANSPTHAGAIQNPSNPSNPETLSNPTSFQPVPEGKEIMGYSLLSQIAGQWYGPVESSTPAGNFDKWYVDFRPISPAQVSGISELDVDTYNFMSFFIVKYKGEYKLAFRNGGGYKGQSRIAYEVIIEAEENPETHTYFYRFADFQAGEQRVSTEVTFHNDTMIMQAFTNKYNELEEPVQHMRWEASLAYRDAADPAIQHFEYPQRVWIKDFSTTFDTMPEAVYLSEEHDPYKETDQPYVGQVTLSYTLDSAIAIQENTEIFLMLTTESLFEGIRYMPDRLKHHSRYIYLSPDITTHTFQNVHPGSYFFYAFYDHNGDRLFTSGDLMNSQTNVHLELKPEMEVSASTTIDFVIP